MSCYVDVAVPIGVRKTFAYSVPPELAPRVKRGIRVLVPFGKKTVSGFVVGIGTDAPPGIARIRPVREVLDSAPLLSDSLLDTALWVGRRYFNPLGDVLRAMMPAGSQVTGLRRFALSDRAKRLLAGGLRPSGLTQPENKLVDALWKNGPQSTEDLKSVLSPRRLDRTVADLRSRGLLQVEETRTRPRIRVKEQLGIAPALGADTPPMSELQKALMGALDPTGMPIPLQRALATARVSIAVARTLERKGAVQIRPMEIARIPAELAGAAAPASHVPTPAQEEILRDLKSALFRETPSRYLLHGVTGSGKTEIYLRMIAHVLNLGFNAVLLVPEIGLTPILSRIAVSHFPEQVAMLHSGMSEGERRDQWQRIRDGKASVVVGTRSAVFAPFDRIRLIVIDEEQDSSYKQEERPYYHAREVAWQRLQSASGLLLLGSATPSIETYHAARVRGDIGYLSLPHRIHERPLAEVTMIDMSTEFERHGKSSVICTALLQELRQCLRRGEQSILLLNRRGYSRRLLCRSCGHVVTCEACSVSMTYHQEEGRLLCHYCGAERKVPHACQDCHGEYIYFVGAGTEQVEELVRRVVPGARIARMDRDTTRRRGSLREMLHAFSQGNIDILVGTQMVAKGHDFPGVTLVGVLGADIGLSFPDFRASERTFQLLTQVAGRAGRGDSPGKVIIQSFYPSHYALRYAREQDYPGFFEHEIEFRRLLGYPPFSRLVQLVISDSRLDTVIRTSDKLAAELTRASAGDRASSGIRVLGPAPAPLEKLKGKYRYQILMKCPEGEDPVPPLRQAFEELGKRRVALKTATVDVDPVSLL